MSTIGRNAPCPCGSGRKYKHCCLKTAASPASALAYSEQERQSGFQKLARFALREAGADNVRLAEALFWAGRLDLAPAERRRELEADEQCVNAFLHWFTLDLPRDLLEDGGGSWTLADQFLRRTGPLSGGERAYLERMGASCPRLYEITDVRVDEGLSLRDLWTGETVTVRERLATHQLVRWDLLGARVIEGPAGAPVLDGHVYLYPCDAKDALLAEFRRHHARVTKELGSEDPARFFKRVGMLFHHLWLDHVALRRMPTIVTAEGDPITPAKVVFDVTDEARVTAVLAGHPQVPVQGDGSYVWLELPGEAPRVLGHLTLTSGRLSLETTSRARAERGRAFIEGVLGSAVRFRMTRYENLDEALARAPRAEREGSDLPAEVEQEVVSQFYDQHYRAWVDQPIPALGGRTPRHAARLKTGRPKVIDLIKGLENHMERERREGRPAYDVTWMWTELGLERPGSEPSC